MENFILSVRLCFRGGRGCSFLTCTPKAEPHTFPKGARCLTPRTVGAGVGGRRLGADAVLGFDVCAVWATQEQ